MVLNMHGIGVQLYMHCRIYGKGSSTYTTCHMQNQAKDVFFSAIFLPGTNDHSCLHVRSMTMHANQLPVDCAHDIQAEQLAIV